MNWTSAVSLIRNLDDFLDRVFCCDLCFDCDGFEAGLDSVYFEEASSVPRSSYGCFQEVDGQVCDAGVSCEDDVLAEADAGDEIVGGRWTLAGAPDALRLVLD